MALGSVAHFRVWNHSVATGPEAESALAMLVRGRSFLGFTLPSPGIYVRFAEFASRVLMHHRVLFASLGERHIGVDSQCQSLLFSRVPILLAPVFRPIWSDQQIHAPFVSQLVLLCLSALALLDLCVR